MKKQSRYELWLERARVKGYAQACNDVLRSCKSLTANEIELLKRWINGCEDVDEQLCEDEKEMRKKTAQARK